MKAIAIGALFVALIVSSVYFKWWRCGEMYPHAQVACFFSEK